LFASPRHRKFFALVEVITDEHANILELSFGHGGNAFLLENGAIAIYAEPINVGIVASKQSLLEKIYAHAMRSLGKILTGVEMIKKLVLTRQHRA
jgi:hypothetical protein